MSNTKGFYLCIIMLFCINLVGAYSEYGAPSEFGNETTTTCYVGGDNGVINCTGNIIGNQICNSTDCYVLADFLNNTYTNTNIIDEGIYNSSELENQSDGKLGVVDSWLTDFINNVITVFSGLFTDLNFTGTTGFDDLVDNDTTYSNLSEFVDDLDHVEDNSSWNETHANTLYAEITEPLWASNLSAHNDSWNNNTDTTYTAGSNLTLTDTTFALNTSAITEWLDQVYVQLSEIVGLVGNWSEDKPNYYNSTQTDTAIEEANTSMKNYVDASAGIWTNESGTATYEDNFNVSVAGEVSVFTEDGIFFVRRYVS